MIPHAVDKCHVTTGSVLRHCHSFRLQDLREPPPFPPRMSRCATCGTSLQPPLSSKYEYDDTGTNMGPSLTIPTEEDRRRWERKALKKKEKERARLVRERRLVEQDRTYIATDIERKTDVLRVLYAKIDKLKTKAEGMQTQLDALVGEEETMAARVEELKSMLS